MQCWNTRGGSVILPGAWPGEGRVKVTPGTFPRGTEHLHLHLKVTGGSLSAEAGREYFGHKDQK